MNFLWFSDPDRSDLSMCGIGQLPIVAATIFFDNGKWIGMSSGMFMFPVTEFSSCEEAKQAIEHYFSTTLAQLTATFNPNPDFYLGAA